jgi:hypothetical protein
MTTKEFFHEFIDVTSHKVEHTLEEFNKIQDSYLVKATTLYQIYKHNVFGQDERLSMREFFRVCGQYLYYDKYVCEHGTEFYYYVKFNENNKFYELTKELVHKRIDANSPENLRDLQVIVKAMKYMED